MNKQLLQSYIIKYDGKQENLAKAMDISLSRLNAKINCNNAEFTQSEIDFIKNRYSLSKSELSNIFFAG